MDPTVIKNANSSAASKMFRTNSSTKLSPRQSRISFFRSLVLGMEIEQGGGRLKFSKRTTSTLDYTASSVISTKPILHRLLYIVRGDTFLVPEKGHLSGQKGTTKRRHAGSSQILVSGYHCPWDISLAAKRVYFYAFISVRPSVRALIMPRTVR